MAQEGRGTLWSEAHHLCIEQIQTKVPRRLILQGVSLVGGPLLHSRTAQGRGVAHVAMHRPGCITGNKREGGY